VVYLPIHVPPCCDQHYSFGGIGAGSLEHSVYVLVGDVAARCMVRVFLRRNLEFVGAEDLAQSF
jgi:hypothetical protein